MSKPKPIPMNQFELVLLAAHHIRKNPNTETAKQLRRCHDRSAVEAIVKQVSND